MASSWHHQPSQEHLLGRFGDLPTLPSLAAAAGALGGKEVLALESWQPDPIVGFAPPGG